MSELVERLPWRLGALGGLVVGAAGVLGGTDLWPLLVRVGAAFAAFYGLGLVLRAVLRGGGGPPPPPNNAGAHVDAKTPDMTPADLHRADPPARDN